MDDCKKITATAKELVVNARDGAKTVNSTLKEISTKLKTVSVTPKDPLKCVRVDLKGLGEEWVPDPTLFRYNEDSLVSADFLLKEFGRGFIDAAVHTDSLLLNVGKAFAETAIGSDVVTSLMNWIRNVHEYQFNYIDILTIGLSKILSEQGIASDIVSKALSKVFSETSIATDTVSKSLQPAKVENAIASDILTAVVDFNLSLQDWAYLTDDVLGNANVDDDQYMSMNKAILELMTYTDVLSTNLTKIFSETAIGTDLLGLSTNKVLSDSVVMSDVFNTVGWYGDSSIFTDVFSKSLSIVLADSSPISETVSKSVSISKTESAVMSETRTANLQNYMVSLYVNAGYIGANYSI